MIFLFYLRNLLPPKKIWNESERRVEVGRHWPDSFGQVFVVLTKIWSDKICPTDWLPVWPSAIDRSTADR